MYVVRVAPMTRPRPIPNLAASNPPHWDEEIARIKAHAAHLATAHNATMVMGVAVDDERKRDYFVLRLQAIVDNETWARHLTFRVVPMLGGAPVDVRRREEP